jgi:hypothetical protein
MSTDPTGSAFDDAWDEYRRVHVRSYNEFKAVVSAQNKETSQLKAELEAAQAEAEELRSVVAQLRQENSRLKADQPESRQAKELEIIDELMTSANKLRQLMSTEVRTGTGGSGTGTGGSGTGTGGSGTGTGGSGTGTGGSGTGTGGSGIIPL